MVAKSRLFQSKPDGEVTFRFAQDGNGMPAPTMQVCCILRGCSVCCLWLGWWPGGQGDGDGDGMPAPTMQVHSLLCWCAAQLRVIWCVSVAGKWQWVPVPDMHARLGRSAALP